MSEQLGTCDRKHGGDVPHVDCGPGCCINWKPLAPPAPEPTQGERDACNDMIIDIWNSVDKAFRKGTSDEDLPRIAAKLREFVRSAPAPDTDKLRELVVKLRLDANAYESMSNGVNWQGAAAKIVSDIADALEAALSPRGEEQK